MSREGNAVGTLTFVVGATSGGAQRFVAWCGKCGEPCRSHLSGLHVDVYNANIKSLTKLL